MVNQFILSVPTTFKTKKHKHVIYCNDIKRYHCNKCDKHFAQSGHLDTHVKLKHCEKVLFCPIEGCGRSFAVKWALRTHLNVHCEEKRFKCSQCNKQFHQKNNLLHHITKTHKEMS